MSVSKTAKDLAILKVSKNQVVNSPVTYNISGSASVNALFSVGKNKFDKTTVTANSKINVSTGVVTTNGAWSEFVSDYIPVLPNTQYATSDVFPNILVQFDSNKTYISGTSPFNNTTPVTMAANAAYVRIQASQLNTFQFEIGATGSYYESYVKYLDPTLLNVVDLMAYGSNGNVIAKLECGKNIYDENQNFLTNTGVNASGNLAAASGQYTSSVFYPIKPSTTYKCNNVWGMNVVQYDSRKKFISTLGTGAASTITTASNAAYVLFQVYSYHLAGTKTQLEIGTVSTFWEPYALGYMGPLSTQKVTERLPWYANKLAMPPKMWFLKGLENSVYYQEVERRHIPGLFYTRCDGAGLISAERYARVTPAATGTSTLTTTMWDAEFDPVDSKTTSIVVTDPATPTTPFSMLSIGDSFTQGGDYIYKIGQLIPNFTSVGMRETSLHPGVKTEGRSGWRLDAYFNRLYEPLYAGFTPFMQPQDPYRYFGNTKTWKEVFGTPTLDSIGFQTVGDLIGINHTTGYPNSPSANDVVYDDTAGTYKYWTGSTWANIAAGSLTFTFNFTKYRNVFQIAKPTAVSVMMGINDFGTDQDLRGVAALFPAWKTRIDTIIAAAQADGISKFALLIPSGCYGRQNNQTGQFSAKKTASIWEARKLMIDNYSSLEGAGVYLIDTGSAFDPDYGHYFSASQKPFSDYAGADLEKFIANEPHPAAEGYYQMAYRIAAWIQSVR